MLMVGFFLSLSSLFACVYTYIYVIMTISISIFISISISMLLSMSTSTPAANAASTSMSMPMCVLVFAGPWLQMATYRLFLGSLEVGSTYVPGALA